MRRNCVSSVLEGVVSILNCIVYVGLESFSSSSAYCSFFERRCVPKLENTGTL